MNISPLFNHINIKPVKVGKVTNAKSYDLRCDTFQFSGKVKPVQWNEAKIQAIFDETYKKVIEQHKQTNPITRDLNLQKPTIKFEEEGLNAAAAYSFCDNTVSISTINLKEDYYLVALVDKNGEIKNSIVTLPKSQLKQTMTLIGKNYKNTKAIRLTDKEKEVYIKATLAHELRHFIQAHLMASTQDCKDTLAVSYNELYKDIKALQDDLKADGYENVVDLEERFKYSKNYQPKKILDKNSTLKFSLFSDDKRKWSIKDHMLQSELAGLKDEISSNENTEEYLALPQEVDAFNYRYEYLLTQLGKYDENFREDIMLAIASEVKTDAQLALDEMAKTGVKFIDE